MTPEQKANELYPDRNVEYKYANENAEMRHLREAYLQGRKDEAASRWIAVEDGCKMPEREHPNKSHSISVWGQDKDGNGMEVFYDFLSKCWYDPTMPIGTVDIVAYHPLPEPYKK